MFGQSKLAEAEVQHSVWGTKKLYDSASTLGIQAETMTIGTIETADQAS